MESQMSNTPIQPPYVGMLFESMEQAATYYENYGKERGFWTRIRDTKREKPRSDEITAAKMVCCREGKHISTNAGGVYVETSERFKDGGTFNENVGTTKNRTSSTYRIDCKAFMRVKQVKYGAGWMVAGFCDDHNHGMITPCKRGKMRSFRKMSKAVKNLAETFHMENLPVGKLPALFGGEHSGFDSRDCWNHMAKFRHKELQSGDAQSVLMYFRKKVEQNPQFYYAIQCDDDGRAVNFFWVDARSRNAYRSFGEVVTFDTTYRTNKYNMPFASFTGVNHHYQSICFGCALLQDESEDIFLWLFDAWLAAMGGRHPMSIITDQDLAMKSAIAKIFPNTHHRLCMWHIKKKFAEKLSHVYFQKSEFKKQMKACIHWTYTEEDFEEQWKGLMVRNEHYSGSNAGFNPSIQPSILDPNLSQTKGRKKDPRGKEVVSNSDRIKSGIEMVTQGRKRLCRSCNKLVNHDKRNCPLNPNSKRRKQLMILEVADDEEEDDMDSTDNDDD